MSFLIKRKRCNKGLFHIIFFRLHFYRINESEVFEFFRDSNEVGRVWYRDIMFADASGILKTDNKITNAVGYHTSTYTAFTMMLS